MLLPLTERDLELLNELVGMRFESRTKDYYEGGVAPIDFGGSNGSHHGKTDTKLAAHGFVDQRMRGHPWGDLRTTGARGSKVYRASEAGRDAIYAWRALREGKMLKSKTVRKYGHNIPSAEYQPLTDDDRRELRLKCHLDMPASG
jgi:hypothetical protein